MKKNLLLLGSIVFMALATAVFYPMPADAGITVYVADAAPFFQLQIGSQTKVFHLSQGTAVSLGEKILLSEKLKEIGRGFHIPETSRIKISRFSDPPRVYIRIENAGSRYVHGTGHSFDAAVENLQVSP